MMMIISPTYHQVMFQFIVLTSPLSVLSSFLFLPFQDLLLYDLARVLNISVMMASCMYWVFPVEGWRRNLEMILVSMDAIVHYRLALSVGWNWCICVFLSQWFFYALSWGFDYIGEYLSALLFWMYLHMFVHFSNLVTYMYIASKNSFYS